MLPSLAAWNTPSENAHACLSAGIYQSCLFVRLNRHACRIAHCFHFFPDDLHGVSNPFRRLTVRTKVDKLTRIKTRTSQKQAAMGLLDVHCIFNPTLSVSLQHCTIYDINSLPLMTEVPLALQSPSHTLAYRSHSLSQALRDLSRVSHCSELCYARFCPLEVAPVFSTFVSMSANIAAYIRPASLPST